LHGLACYTDQVSIVCFTAVIPKGGHYVL
jgi:hypothetical protein